MKHLLLFLYFLAISIGCAGSLRAVIFDANGLKKEVYNITTDKGGIIEVLDGLAVRRLNLKKVSVIKISPKETKSYKGELYYLTEIWLTDGNKIQSYVLPDGRRSGSYINVNSSIIAKTDNGTYTIKIKDIRQVKFIRL